MIALNWDCLVGTALKWKLLRRGVVEGVIQQDWLSQ
jgi:hypothetical protein